MLKIINHPIIKEKLSRMRNKDTKSKDFRLNLTELSQFMAFEVTKNFETITYPIETPVSKTNGYDLKDTIVLVPILRAGLGMVDGFKNMLPNSPIGHLGLYRDEKTLEAIEYYCKMPNKIENSIVILLDPMLATGHSLIKGINLVRRYKPKSIILATVLASPEGIKLIEEYDSKLQIFTCSLDEKLNKNGYIVPGLGDAGDRIFNTE